MGSAFSIRTSFAFLVGCVLFSVAAAVAVVAVVAAVVVVVVATAAELEYLMTEQRVDTS